MTQGQGRQTFIVTVRRSVPGAEVENVRTGERERVSALVEIGACVGRWARAAESTSIPVDPGHQSST
jgi:hypothetical protein